MTLSLPVARSLVIFPTVAFTAFWTGACLEIDGLLAVVLLFLIPLSCIPAMCAVCFLWKRETITLRWTWLWVCVIETIIVVVFLFFVIQFIKAFGAAMAELRFKIMFGPFIWLFHELHFDR